MNEPLPHDNDLEMSVLGAILLEADAINSVIGIITNDRIFYNERNRKVWNAITSLFHEDRPIDSVTVFEKLKSIHKKYAKELAVYLTDLIKVIGSAANIETHALFLKEIYVRRVLIEIGMRSQKNGFDTSLDAFDIYDSVLTELDSLNGEINRTSHREFHEIVTDKILKIKEAGQSHNYTTGVKSYLTDLDRVTLGFQQTDLIIIAARPSMGKTAMAIDIARKQAKNNSESVAIFSLEMSSSQLTDRILSAETKIPLETIRKGGLKKEEWSVLDFATQTIKGYQIHICDKGGLTINEICSIAKNWKLKYGIKIIFIDYLQLITNTGNKNGSREQEISGISRRLKQLAKELNVPVIALSQLSRKCEERADKRPMLSDLRESGAIEQDADMVIFPFREDYYNEQAEPGKVELIIAKNRNGKTGKVDCHFDLSTQLFSDYENTFRN